MSILARLQLFKLFIQLIRNPNRTDLIFKGVEIVSRDPNQPELKAIEDGVMAHACFKEMYVQQYCAKIPDLEHLKTCPDGSFGRSVYDHMYRYGLTFDLFPQLNSERIVNYLSARIYQDHDLWHALMGYGVEIEDELAIQAFGIAQFRSPIAVVLVAGGLLHLLVKSPQRALSAFAKVNDGYNLGKRIPFLLGVKLHELFDRPLSEVREICAIAG